MRYPIIIGLLLLGLCAKAQITREAVSFNHGGCQFRASITKPTGAGPFTTLVLVPGSGQNDRDGRISLSGANAACLYPGLNGQTLTIYKDLAEDLAQSGYAVLHYDELTVSCPGYSGSLSYSHLFLPAMSAIDYLKTRSDVDTNKLILMGHSEGAQLISYMASERKDIKATISLAGARTPFDSILAYQIVEIARNCGQDTNQAKNQAQQILTYFNAIRNGNYNASTPAFGGTPPATWEKYIQVADSVAILYNQNGLPTLMIGMDQDFNVPPSELTRFQQSLSGDFSFYSLPGLNHYMTPATVPRVSPQVADTIVYWLGQKAIGLERPSTVNNSLKVYPNPLAETLFIELPEGQGNVKLKMQTSSGQMVWSKDFEEGTQKVKVEVPRLRPGIYLITCQTDLGVFTSKILRE